MFPIPLINNLCSSKLCQSLSVMRDTSGESVIPDSKKFSWRIKSPVIQRRLVYWLISNLLQDDVAKVDIVTAIKTDHHAITLEIDSVDDQQPGPSFWKYNDSLLDDVLFVERLYENFPTWQDLIKFCDDLRIKWDWMKHKIREESITYSKLKAKERKKSIQIIENRLKIHVCEEKIAESPTQENLANLELAKTEYEKENDYIVRGLIICSRATLFEQGERNSKYFFSLENRNKKKSCIWKLIRTNGNEATVPDTQYYGWNSQFLLGTLWRKVGNTNWLLNLSLSGRYPFTS